MTPSDEQLRTLYNLIAEHQLKGEPLVRAQILPESTLRVTFGSTVAYVEGQWFIDPAGYDTQ